VSDIAALAARSALAGVAVPSRSGRADGEPGVLLHERVDVGIARWRRARAAAAPAEVVQRVYGVALPTDRAMRPGMLRPTGTGPGQWLAVSTGTERRPSPPISAPPRETRLDLRPERRPRRDPPR
jgi:hypothetical protein